MSWSLQYLSAQASRWSVLATTRSQDVAPDITSGLRGYAMKQATLRHRLASTWATQWIKTFTKLGLSHTWLMDYQLDKSQHCHQPPDLSPASNTSFMTSGSSHPQRSTQPISSATAIASYSPSLSRQETARTTLIAAGPTLRAFAVAGSCSHSNCIESNSENSKVSENN